MKTIEFKLDLNQSQQVTVEEWLGALRWVWNKALSLTESFYQFRHYNKHDKAYASCSPIGWEYRYIEVEGEKTTVPFCRIAADTKEYKPGFCSVDYDALGLQNVTHFGLGYYFAHKNHPNKPWLQAVPSKFINGTVQSLADAWAALLKGKRKRKPITSLVNNNAKSIKVTGKYIRIPNLGLCKVKGLDKRWIADMPISVLKVLKRPSGYYLQLTGDIHAGKVSPSDKAIGIDVGLKSLYTDDKGKQINPRQYYKKLSKRLARLQRKIARQKKGSKNQNKSYKCLAKLHEKVRLQRRAFNHKLSTKLVREYGAIAVEDIRLKNLTRRPKKKEREDGKGYAPNGAKRKSGLNRSFADAGIGQLLSMIEEKSKVFDREFVRIPPHHTSQTCNKCGHCEPGNRSTQSKFLCLSCGHSDHADSNAAKNILQRGLATFVRSYRSWEWEVKPVEVATPLSDGDAPSGDAESSISRQVRQEAIAVAPGAELCAPFINTLSSSSTFAKLREDLEGDLDNGSQLLTQPSFQQLQIDLGTCESSQSFAGAETEVNSKRKRQKKKPVLKSLEEGLAKKLLELPVQLGLWDAALENSVERN
jgi:putative transposase